MVHYSRGHSCPYTLATPSRTGPGRKCGHTERHRDVVGERGRIVPVPHVHMQLGFVDYEWSTTLEGTCVFTHLLHHRARDPAESVDIQPPGLHNRDHMQSSAEGIHNRTVIRVTNAPQRGTPTYVSGDEHARVQDIPLRN